MQVPTDPSLSRILQLQDPHHVDHNSGCADGALDLWQEALENEGLNHQHNFGEKAV